MPGEKQQTGVSRRTLVKSAALGSLALAAGGVSLPFGMRTAAAAVQQAMRNEEDKRAPVRSTAAVAAPCVCM